jgi:hypothetical protein
VIQTLGLTHALSAGLMTRSDVHLHKINQKQI